MTELRFVPLSEADGEYLRLAGKPVRLQYREVYPGAGHTPWLDVKIETTEESTWASSQNG